MKMLSGLSCELYVNRVLPDVVQEVPRLVGRDVLRDEELRHDALQVPERPGVVRDQGGEGFFRVCCEKSRNRTQGCLAVEEVAGEVPFGYRDRNHRVPEQGGCC
jgi:hypothetical protein